MNELTKPMKRVMRALVAKAHEEDLRRELLPLAEAFGKWRGGTTSSGELVERIHEFHQGAARDVYKRYEHGDLVFTLASAIARGLIRRDEVPADILETCGDHLKWLESEQE
jgi:hypothetical protein